MSSPDVRDDWLVFSSRIEVVLLIEEWCFSEIIRDIFQHVLPMNFSKNDNNDVVLVNLANMIKSRPVIPSVVHLVKLM